MDSPKFDKLYESLLNISEGQLEKAFENLSQLALSIQGRLKDEYETSVESKIKHTITLTVNGIPFTMAQKNYGGDLIIRKIVKGSKAQVFSLESGVVSEVSDWIKSEI